MTSCLFEIVIGHLDITILDFAQQLLNLFAKHLRFGQPGNSACILDQSFQHGTLGWKLFVLSLTFSLLSLLAFCVVLGARLLCLLFICEQPKVFAKLHLLLMIIAHNWESTRSRKQLSVIAQRMSVVGQYRSGLVIRGGWQFLLDDRTRELLLLLLLLYFLLLKLILLRLFDCLGQVCQVTRIVNRDFKLSINGAGFLILQ